MSKAAAMQLLTGLPATNLKPSLVTPDVDPNKTTETPAPESTEVPKPEDTVNSNRLAILAKREVALQKDRELIKKEREEFLKEKTESDQFKTQKQQFDELSKSDKVAALKLLGWNDTDIINIMANVEEKKEGPEEIARRIAQEESQKIRDDLKRDAEESQRLNNERLIGNLKKDISEQIKSESEKYEYCAFEGADAEAKAYEFITDILKADGVLISVDEALQMAESFYEERANAMQALKKRQPKPADGAVVAEPEKDQAPARTAPVSNIPQKPKTLTNSMTATTAAAAVNRRESPSEKRERLIKAIQDGKFS